MKSKLIILFLSLTFTVSCVKQIEDALFGKDEKDFSIEEFPDTATQRPPENKDPNADDTISKPSEPIDEFLPLSFNETRWDDFYLDLHSNVIFYQTPWISVLNIYLDPNDKTCLYSIEMAPLMGTNNKILPEHIKNAYIDTRYNFPFASLIKKHPDAKLIKEHQIKPSRLQVKFNRGYQNRDLDFRNHTSNYISRGPFECHYENYSDLKLVKFELSGKQLIPNYYNPKSESWTVEWTYEQTIYSAKPDYINIISQ